MDKLLPKLKRKISKYRQQDRTVSKKDFVIGGIIGIFIAASPYLFYLYESVPDQQVWNTFLFTYNSKGWGSANLSMWILTGKIIPLIFLVIWFFTNRHWWYHALLVPITMYTYQIVVLFNDDNKYIDEFQLIYILPVMAVIIPSIYLIRAQIFNKINNAGKSMKELEEEFMIKPKGLMGTLKQYF
ncbi:hypothetical protein [Sediminibacter sp. Hel_I_10]|uniref:hypothetical protein n=1 Tax=Sediminibacter sp. Hel_I_10 TaxID=1392490 RepID=UPI00047C4F90|nr:hypothetical protein [Sediminibacter sp. Hel_I_10]